MKNRKSLRNISTIRYNNKSPYPLIFDEGVGVLFLPPPYRGGGRENSPYPRRGWGSFFYPPPPIGRGGGEKIAPTLHAIPTIHANSLILNRLCAGITDEDTLSLNCQNPDGTARASNTISAKILRLIS